MTKNKLDNFGTKISQWKPGQSGNPKGRPPKLVSITGYTKDKLSIIDEATGKTKAELIADKLIELALGGNLDAIKEIFNRIDGKVVDKHELESTQPVTLIFQPAPKANYSLTVEGETKELGQGCPNCPSKN